MAACIVLNTGTSKCQILQECLREICFLSAVSEFQIKLQHLSSESNRISDYLSRWYLSETFQHKFLEETKEYFLKEEKVDKSYFQFVNNW